MRQSNTIPATSRFLTSLVLVCLASGILLGGCDSQDPHFDFPRDFGDEVIVPPPHQHSGPVLPTYEEVFFEHGNYRFRLLPDGIVREAEWNSVPGVADSTLRTIFSGGLWMSGVQQNRVRSNTARYSSNFFPTKLALEAFSMYHFRASDVTGDISNWPDSLGAPVLESNLPAVWGDIMSMAPFVTGSDPRNYIVASGFDDVQVVQTVFGVGLYGLRDVFFVRYDITNKSVDRLEDVHLGIFTDTDLAYLYSPTCRSLVNYTVNRTGFDFDRKLSYSYSMPEGADVDEPCLGVATGYLILETATDLGVTIQPGSHRMFRRQYGPPRGFEESMLGPQETLWAMKGLSRYGDTMINPVTGQVTKWAYTGNPVDSTGWIAEPGDARSLLSTESFALESGEHVDMTVAWITARDETLALALDEMRFLANILIANPSLWRYPN